MGFLHPIERHIAGLALLLAFGLSTFAGGEEPVWKGPAAAAVNDPSEGARQAVVRFMKAVDEGDAKTLRDAIFCDFNVTAQKQGLLAVVDCIVFQRALEEAMAARWGEESIASMARRTTFSQADIDAVAVARVDERESKDTVVLLASPMVVRPCNDGKWRVVLRAVHSLEDSKSIDHGADRVPRRLPEESSRKQIVHFRGVALTLRRAAKAVDDGDYASFEEASMAFQKAMNDAMDHPPAYDEALDGPEKEVPEK